jgi:hypothetical protein
MPNRRSRQPPEGAAAPLASDPSAPPSPARERLALWSVLGVLAAAAWSGVVSATTPFTTAADVVVALPIGLMALVVAVQLTRSRRPPSERRWRSGEWLPWLVALVVLAAWELCSYFLAPRSAHPTLSSLYDTAARWQAAKAAVCFAWLVVGWYLVRLPLGSRRHR